MAEYTAEKSKPATTAAGVQDTVTLNFDAQAVRVLKRTEAGELWVKVDSQTDVEVAGDDAYCLPVGIGERIIASHKKGDTTVKLISSGVVDYWVAAVE